MLAVAAPHAPADVIGRAAYGVLAIALGNVFMSDLEVSPERTALARTNAEVLLAAVYDRQA